MPGVVVEGVNEEVVEGVVDVTLSKQNSVQNNRSPKSTLSPQSPRSVQDEDVSLNEALDTSIEQLYDNVCEMQSSDQSPSRRSYSSEDNESRIDSELRHLVGGGMREVEIMEEEVAEEEEKEEENRNVSEDREVGSSGGKPEKSKKGSDEGTKTSLEKSSASWKDKKGKVLRKKVNVPKKLRNFPLAGSDAALDNPDLGPFLLKQAREIISSGDNLHKALDFATRASKSFEICADGNPSLELIMSLHVTAAVYCSLGRYNEAIPVLKRSIELPSVEDGENYALAKFAGNMQLGDTFAMLGQLGNSIACYTSGLEIQKEVLGEKDLRIGETCRYLAEVHVQAMQFDEAEKLCEMALDIHRESGSPGSLEEAADRRLMGLIYETKGEHEKALEHLVLASMAMVANGQEKEVASVDCSIGDTYLSLSRYDEAIFAYEKALTNFKSAKGENHPVIASVFVRLADLYNKTGKLRESKSYCENALRIYNKPVPGITPEDIASGFTDVSAIYESMNELDQAIKLLQKALKIYNDAPGQQNTIAGIEAQMGVMFYVLGNYTESYNSFKSAIIKMRASGEKKSAFFGLALNQMGLACVQRYAINEATDLFEEARGILEQEYGPYHPDTLGVYSNLAGTYDAMGRLEDAIELLEYVVGMREEKLGTANPDVDDEKRRLTELLKEAGRVRSRKARSLENLFDGNSQRVTGDFIKV
ncbi:hypothetical protein RND81_13G129000 [Saponaria officinalis]|uniref:Kinesin light chain n=1 Tax=Saponaria officinalis TaxID=3572 RepID=A0AAW1H0X6_SAPOF